MFIRFLIFIAVLFVVSLILIKLARFFLLRWIAKNLPRPPQSQPMDVVDSLVPCAHCGVFVPKTQAITHQDCYYCSNEHRAKAVQGGRNHGDSG